MSGRAELHPAYVWDCPDCGQENFCRSVVAEMTNEDHLQQLKSMGVVESYATEVPEEMRDVCWQTAPTRVICIACERAFNAQYMFDHLDEQDDV